MPDSTSSSGQTVALIQARMGSRRLPGKMLADLGGRPLLQRLVARVRTARLVNGVAIATTTLPEDDPIASLASGLGVACHRGAGEDVLDRMRAAARAEGASTVVRLTGDNPLVDASLVDRAVAAFAGAEPPLDHLEISTAGGFPFGISVEVLSFAALETAWRETEPELREHVTLAIRRHPARFRSRALPAGGDHTRHRWTVDTADDLARVRRIFQHFGDAPFTWTDALHACEAHPEWQGADHAAREAAR